MYSISLTFTTLISVSFICFSPLSIFYFSFSHKIFSRETHESTPTSFFPACLLPMRPIPTQSASLLLAQPFEHWIRSCRSRHTIGTSCIWGFLFIFFRESWVPSPAHWVSPGWRRTGWRRVVSMFSSGIGYSCGFNLSSGSLRDEKGRDRTRLCTLLSPGWLMTGERIIFVLSNFTEYRSRASELFCWQVVPVSWGAKMLRAALQNKRSHGLA